MRRAIPFIITFVVTIALVIVLDRKWGSVPAMGRFLSPQTGFWQNAEATDHDFNAKLNMPDLKGSAQVYLDERMVPHVFAGSDEDGYFIQGYLHAKFRLWQMEFQTLATAGRLSEIVGDRALNYDREQRRMGLTFAAENMVKAMEENDRTRAALESYTAGVNAYISRLTARDLPVEYKLLGYKPEKWTHLKTALFVKQLTKTLAGYGYGNDFQYTNLHTIFTDQEMRILFPYAPDSLSPIIPKGTVYPPASTKALPLQGSPDSIYLDVVDTVSITKVDPPTPGIGSNNWAVSGSKTMSGAPILCNDPHLELNFPSIWFEMQLNTPSFNAYGVTFPGIPGIVIGFNDHIAFGFTNGGVDVMDFYRVRFRDDSKKEYWFNGEWAPTRLRVEEIRVRGEKTFYDTVAYTRYGPVMYDKSFTNVSSKGHAVAIRWKAHDPSNELLMWWWLDRATSYEDYVNAIPYFECPVQNIVFASKRGDIAIWQQGKVPLRWKRQGMYLMPGEDERYDWQGYIPQEENPHTVNPARGFVSSANQRATDTTYPYYVPGEFSVYRGWRINNRLAEMEQITPADMMALQNDNHNSMAEIARPMLLKYVDETQLQGEERKFLDIFKTWNLENNLAEKGPVVFELWLDSLNNYIWRDEFSRVKDFFYPDKSTLIDLLIKDSALVYADDITTPVVETIGQQVTAAFKSIVPVLVKLDKLNSMDWGHVNATTIYHLLRTAVVPFARQGIPTTGGREIVNATRKGTGPSWRMVVQLSEQTEAYGVYPGGQSGNPGSRYYDNFVNAWANGEYFRLWVMKATEAGDKRVKAIIQFEK